MTDCPNAEMRDRLPDLLHERLEDSVRALVLAHVGDCAECHAELALLRKMRGSLSSNIVAIDTTVVARAVVSRTIAAPRAGQRSRWVDWRIAAAIAVLAVGGASFATFRATRSLGHQVTAVVPPVATTQTQIARVPESPAAPVAPHRSPGSEERAPRAGAELAAAGDVSDLSDSDLRTLLGDLDTIEAVPPTDPEPVTVRVSLPDPGGSE